MLLYLHRKMEAQVSTEMEYYDLASAPLLILCTIMGIGSGGQGGFSYMVQI